MFLGHWIMLYGIPPYIWIHNGTQITGKMFSLLCTHLDKKQRTTTSYSLQTNGKVEQYKTYCSTTLPPTESQEFREKLHYESILYVHNTAPIEARLRINVRKSPIFLTTHLVYIYKPPLFAFSARNADGMAAASNNNL